MDLFEVIVGPLVAPECRRALSKRWLFWLRAASALPAVGVVLITLWVSWFYNAVINESAPASTLPVALVSVTFILLTGALLITPAIVAGVLAEEKVRGTLGLLLASKVSAWEIAVARLIGRLSVVGVLLLGSVPLIVLFSSLVGAGMLGLVLLLGVLAAVAFGSGGIALAASAVARRGRDALVAVVMIDLLLLLAPFANIQLPWHSLGVLNPYYAINLLIYRGDTVAPLASGVAWFVLGLAGTAFAAWRVRPSYLRQSDGAKKKTRAVRRPPVSERPMLWKELHIERNQSMNRLVRWLLNLAVGGVMFATLALGGLISWAELFANDPKLSAWAEETLWLVVRVSSLPLCWLIQWSMALRAAGAISSERERAAWDSLLTSPLEGREIVGGKIIGSLYSMRGLLIAAVVTWTVAVLLETMSVGDYFSYVATTIVCGLFITIVGVRFSLTSNTVGKAMTMTLGVWLATQLMSYFFAFLLASIVFLAFMLMWLAWAAATDPNAMVNGPAGPPSIIGFGALITIFRLALYAIAAFALTGRYARRFDSLAGRACGEGYVILNVAPEDDEEVHASTAVQVVDDNVELHTERGDSSLSTTGTHSP